MESNIHVKFITLKDNTSLEANKHLLINFFRS